MHGGGGAATNWWHSLRAGWISGHHNLLMLAVLLPKGGRRLGGMQVHVCVAAVPRTRRQMAHTAGTDAVSRASQLLAMLTAGFCVNWLRLQAMVDVHYIVVRPSGILIGSILVLHS